MNKSIIASAIISALLTGCGSGGGGSSSATTYTWQIVQLQSVKESNLSASCIIYADSDPSDTNVITAYKATSNYNILYHNSDGSVSEKFSADYYTNGKVTISKSDVPDNGYVSLEEEEGVLSGTPNIYMFSVEKSLLTDLVVNVRDGNISSCYTGNDYRATENSDSAVIYANIEKLEYYQTSYDKDSVSGKTSVLKIPVVSPATPEHDVLVTAFTGYDADTEKKTGLSYFAFATPSQIYDSSETDISFVSFDDALETDNFSWSYSVDSGINVSLDESASNVYALHDDVVYLWQPLYELLNITIADTNEISHWSAYFSGSYDSSKWEFENYVSFDSDISFTLPALYSFSSTSIDSDCIIDDETVSYCVDLETSYSSDDFIVQRTHVEMTDDDDNTMYQSVYASASNYPIILESSYYDDLSVYSIDSIETNLVKSDADTEDAVQYLMSQSIDEVSLGDDNTSINEFNDANGFVATSDEQDALELAINKSTTIVVKNAYEE